MTTRTRSIRITSEYITLGQFLKFADVVSSGSEAKFFLQTNDVLINNELDNRRGRKLREGDTVEISGTKFVISK